jgi:hypothetical protein
MFNALFRLSLAVVLHAASYAMALDSAWKPRVVILTDISPDTVEPDDTESMVRLLAHADEFEIEGLIATTGWSNGGGNERPDLILGLIEAYGKDLPNLRRRSRQEGHLEDESRQRLGYWPSAEYLRSRTMVGSKTRGMRFIGRDNDTPGSEFILQLGLEADERPIWVLAWGGANTLAQAIWRAREDWPAARFQTLLRRLRLYTITDQDRSYEKGTPFEISSHQWLRREFKRDLFHIWDESAWMYQNGTGKAEWKRYAEEIQGHGHLGSRYPKYRYGVEGDTPSFVYVQVNGLNDPDSPGLGNWGGFFEWGTGADGVTEAYVNQTGSPAHAVSRKYESRFYPAIFNRFAARMDWARDGAGNREPELIVDGIPGRDFVRYRRPAGAVVSIDASASRDPDGDALRFSWWIIHEAGNGSEGVLISGADTGRATLTMPAGEKVARIHVVCEATDNGMPPLTSYRRIILESTPAIPARP